MQLNILQPSLPFLGLFIKPMDLFCGGSGIHILGTFHQC